LAYQQKDGIFYLLYNYINNNSKNHQEPGDSDSGLLLTQL